MTRPDPELRAEMERMKARARACREARQPIDAICAAIIVNTLAYALGDVPTPTTRVKIE